MSSARTLASRHAAPAAGAARDLRRSTRIALLLLALLLAQGACFIGESSQTSDEAAHIVAGYSYITKGDFRLNPEHPPLIKEIAAVPLLLLDLSFPLGPLWEAGEEWNLGRIFVHENRHSNDTILLLARMPILLLSLLLGWGIFLRARRLFGPRAALLSLALYALDPNVVAHSSLVTTDLGVTLFMFLSIHALWHWSERPAPRRLLLVGLTVGGAFASKYTALWLVPIFAALGLTLLLTRAPLPRRPLSRRCGEAPGGALALPRIAALAGAAAVVVAVAAVVVTITYAGSGLPAYLVGLERGLKHSAAGHRAYLMGEITDGGWWYYFLFALAVKTPIGTLALIALSFPAALAGARRGLRDELFLWLPILITLLITCLWKVNIGLRHLLPIYPFLFISAGRLATAWLPGRSRGEGAVARARGALVPIAAALCLSWNLVEAARIAPHQLAYFNQFAGGPANGHLVLLDSNLDWGQSAKALRRFVDATGLPAIYCAFSGNSDPWYYGVRYQYVPGSGNLEAARRRYTRVPGGVERELFAISAMVRHSTHFSDHHLYDWLDGREPVAMPGYSYLLYDVTGDADSHARIALLCLNFRLLDLAGFEARRALRYDPGNELAQEVLRAIREYEEAAGESAAPGAPRALRGPTRSAGAPGPGSPPRP
ncbi:MAG: ArnT family glycosyltransferase [Acidobacteriota bacterium]